MPLAWDKSAYKVLVEKKLMETGDYEDFGVDRKTMLI
jgi:hypothetical protein